MKACAVCSAASKQRHRTNTPSLAAGRGQEPCSLYSNITFLLLLLLLFSAGGHKEPQHTQDKPARCLEMQSCSLHHADGYAQFKDPGIYKQVLVLQSLLLVTRCFV